jgi:hypothetical protein
VSATKSRHFTIRFSNRRIYRIFSPSRAGVPTFKCEPEPVVAATVDPKFLEWQTVLNGSDEQFAREVCATAGKPYPPESDRDKAILAEMIQARHQMPVAYGSLAGAEMFGNTQPL